MKTNHALVAYTPTEDPQKGDIIHTCFFENHPTQNDINSLIEELATDDEFGMTDLIFGEDYFIHKLSPDNLQAMKKDRNIPDILD